MAFIGVWALFPADATAVGWAVLMIGTALGARLLNSKQFLAQAWLFTIAVIIRTAVINCHSSDLYPHHITARLVTLPMLSLASPGCREFLRLHHTCQPEPRCPGLAAGQ